MNHCVICTAETSKTGSKKVSFSAFGYTRIIDRLWIGLNHRHKNEESDSDSVDAQAIIVLFSFLSFFFVRERQGDPDRKKSVIRKKTIIFISAMLH